MNLLVFMVIALVLGLVIWLWTRSVISSLLIMATILAIKVPWFWIAVVPFALWQASLWFLHNSRPWRRIHFPMMRIYAAAAGLEQAEAEREKREWDIRNVLIRMVASAHPDWTLPKILFFLGRELANIETLRDRELMRMFFLRKHPGADAKKIEEFLDDIQSQINMSDKGLLARAVIAGLVEKKYGEEQKGEYLYAIFTGKAI